MEEEESLWFESVPLVGCLCPVGVPLTVHRSAALTGLRELIINEWVELGGVR